MPNDATTDRPADLREYLRVALARKWEIVAITVVAVVASVAWSFHETPMYEGRAKVLVKPIQAVTTTSISLPQAPNLDTERELVLSDVVAERVRSTAPGTSAAELLQRVSVDVVADTEVLVIRYRDPSPATAARLANAFASSYVRFRSAQATGQVQTSLNAVQQRLEQVQAQADLISHKIDATKDEAEITALRTQQLNILTLSITLQQRLLDLQAAETISESSALIVEPASAPTGPVSPQKTRDAILALFVGLLLGVAAAFVRERLDDRIGTRDELERRLGSPVLATVPRVPGWRRDDEAHLVTRSDPKSPISESYRTLATNIQYIASKRPLRAIMVTSSLGGEGKSTTSANLAVVLAQAGKRVILVSADLRRPRVHRFFGVANDVGMANVLSEGLSVSQVAKEVGIPNLRVIVGGPVPSDPAALLGSDRLRDFIQGLREVADFVLLDCPPVLAVADASILAPHADGTIFVMDAQRSSRSALQHSRDQLENAGATMLGSVYNNLDPRKSSSYPYAYAYYQAYLEEDRSANGRGSRGPRSRRHADHTPEGGDAPARTFAGIH